MCFTLWIGSAGSAHFARTRFRENMARAYFSRKRESFEKRFPVVCRGDSWLQNDIRFIALRFHTHEKMIFASTPLFKFTLALHEHSMVDPMYKAEIRGILVLRVLSEKNVMASVSKDCVSFSRLSQKAIPSFSNLCYLALLIEVLY